MNAAASASDGQDAFQRLASQQPYRDLVKPANVRSFTFLSEEQRKTFSNGIAKLWEAIKTKPVEDPLHVSAVTKLKEMTKSFLGQLQKQQNADRNASQMGVQRPTSQGQPQTQTSIDGTQQSQPSQVPPQVQQSQQQQQQVSNQNLMNQEVPEVYRQQAERVNWLVPSGVPNPQVYRDDIKKKYASQLAIQEKAKGQLARMDSLIQSQRQQGNQVPPQWAKARASQEENMNLSKQFIENLMKQQSDLRAQMARTIPGQVGNIGASQNLQAQTAGQQGAQQGGSNMRPLPQNAQQANRPGSSSVSGQATQAGPHANISSSSQAPQVNPMAQGPRHPNPSAAGAFTQSPQSAIPQSASSQQQPPIALTHQNAMDAAARSYSSAGTQQQPAANATGGQASSTQSFSRGEVEKQNTSNRWPMSKGFIPPTPQAVQMPPARPTLTGAGGPTGVMGQPAIQQAPSFNLQGPGDRVLDKKKLDELVRQVCGGSGQGLHPEVEEVCKRGSFLSKGADI